jgi:hypothetical protein
MKNCQDLAERYNIQHNDTQNNDTQNSNTQNYDNHNYEIENNDTLYDYTWTIPHNLRVLYIKCYSEIWNSE